MERKTGPLKNIFPTEWFEDSEIASGWLRLYTVLFIPKEHLDKTMGKFLSAIKNKPQARKRPFFFGFGNLTDFKVPRTSMVMYSEPSGVVRVEVNIKNDPLPETNYIFLGTPYSDRNLSPNETETKRQLNSIASLICLHAGQNLMRELVYEGEVSLKDGKYSVPGSGWKMPQLSEGPFLAIQNATDFAEMEDQIDGLGEPKKGRIRLALQLMDSAMRSYYGFFEYWTGLEVLCDGRAGKIQTRFAQLYDIKNHAEASRQSGLQTLSRWRHDFFHKGLRPQLTADVERYIQLLFLDLLRHELGLPLRGHVSSLLQAPGYDLSPLGLQDNRTEAQKAAASVQQT